MGIVRDLYYARKMSAGLKLPAPTVALLIKRLRLAAAMGGGVTKTVSGSPAHITDALAKAALSVLVNIEPIQDLHGYSSPWPAGGGKNKFDASLTTFKKWQLSSNAFEPKSDDYGHISFSVSGDNITLTTNITYGGICFAVDAVDYDRTASLNGTISGGKAISFYDSYTSGATRISTGATSCLIPANTSGYVAIRLDSAQTCIINCQIEQGSTATSWTTYSNICPISGRTGLSVYVSPTQDVADATTYAVDWTSEAGTVYHGTVDPVAGQLTINGIVNVFNGNESFNGTYWPTVVCTTDLPGVGDYNHRSEMRCSHCETGSRGVGFASPAAIFIQFKKVDEVFCVNNATEFATYVATQYANGTPVTVYYPLATPITYQLTPQEVQMLLGENYVWSSSGDTVSVTYYAEGNANDLQSLNILLGGNYSNPKTADDVSDKEALEIILGGNK